MIRPYPLPLQRPTPAPSAIVTLLATGGIAMLSTGCLRNPPPVAGVRSTAPSPSQFWTPPSKAIAPPTPTAAGATPPTVPADLESKLQQLQLADVVDLALRNNPATRITWENARATAAAYGSERGGYLPTLSFDGTATRSHTVGSATRFGGERTQYQPTVTLSYLLFDFGGRSNSVDAAREAVYAANLTHNATVQDVVLQVASAYFTYIATGALRDAQQSTVQEANANVKAAQQRHDVGLATIADVLQAKTALAEAQLALETTQGNLQAARGALAVAMGLPANTPYDIARPEHVIPIRHIAESVDSLIDQAVSTRPDLQAARAQVQQSLAQVRVSKSLSMPALMLSGNAGRTFSSENAFSGNSYALTLGLSFPIFTGFSRSYDIMNAEAQAEAARASAASLRQQVIDQVFTSYYALQTATQRVTTADALLASAEQSEQVARGRYTEGVGSILDLLTAQSALANARAQQVQARWVWSTALAQLAHDTGILGLHGEAPLRFSTDSTERHQQ
ncbi:MAG TPA: TolC family protein [Gemmatimonadaceae bacterium]|nr:TolC family protein [Gemmatimonadaceae bacterium]